jgi:hypothetical protein
MARCSFFWAVGDLLIFRFIFRDLFFFCDKSALLCLCFPYGGQSSDVGTTGRRRNSSAMGPAAGYAVSPSPCSRDVARIRRQWPNRHLYASGGRVQKHQDCPTARLEGFVCAQAVMKLC